jgi:hypothetical protein
VTVPPREVEELPVVEDDADAPAVKDEPPLPQPRRRRLPRRRERGSGVPRWLPNLGIGLLCYALGTVCFVIAVKSDFYQFLFGAIFFFIIGTVAILRIFGWTP